MFLSFESLEEIFSRNLMQLSPVLIAVNRGITDLLKTHTSSSTISAPSPRPPLGQYLVEENGQVCVHRVETDWSKSTVIRVISSGETAPHSSKLSFLCKRSNICA